MYSATSVANQLVSGWARSAAILAAEQGDEIVHLQRPGLCDLFQVWCGDEKFGAITAFPSLVTCEQCKRNAARNGQS